MSFPRYPKYKDSGVVWLGEVPKHWKKGKFSKYGQYGQFQQGSFGDEVMLNPQPLPPSQFHYVNWN